MPLFMACCAEASHGSQGNVAMAMVQGIPLRVPKALPDPARSHVEDEAVSGHRHLVRLLRTSPYAPLEEAFGFMLALGGRRLTIAAVDVHGLLERRNSKVAKEQRVYPGDHIVQVNGARGHEEMLRLLREDVVVEMVIDRAPLIEVSLEKSGGQQLVGLKINSRDKALTVARDSPDAWDNSVELTDAVVTIVAVLEDGIVALHNERNPADALVVGARVLEVNSKRASGDINRAFATDSSLSLTVRDASFVPSVRHDDSPLVAP